jgi:dihydrofolate synthase/folylpolyglutamate synthase
MRHRKALLNINWPGRMQLLSRNPVLIVDGAHNVHGIKALKRSLDKIYPNRKLKFLLSILPTKTIVK